MRKALVVFVVAALFVPGAVALAKDRPDVDKGPRFTPLEKQYLKVYPKARTAFGYETVGRNIVRTGMTNTKAATQSQIRESKDRMESWLNPPEVPATTTTASPGASSASYGGGGGLCGASCVQCESGGNPDAQNPAGYWGLYQFDYGTWVANGGDPAAYGSASPAEQSRVAGNVTYDAWPNC